MQYDEWKSIYLDILKDMEYSSEQDETSARILKLVTVDSDLIDEDVLYTVVKNEVTVFGNSTNLREDIKKMPPKGTLIASGSSVQILLSERIVPDIIVTDLDGDMSAQIEASDAGAISVLHAHGDNVPAILMYASRFTGPVLLTTQSKPRTIVFNYGGFSDGDRAVCLARHFGAKKIYLEGFDFEHPNFKEKSDPQIKLKKLKWAKKIIYDHNSNGVEIIKI